MNHFYPPVDLVIVNNVPHVVNADTGEIFDTLELYGMIVYYRAVCEHQDANNARLYEQMSNSWTLQAAANAAMEEMES